MQLRRLLRLQMIYFGLAFIYNIISLYLGVNNGQFLTPTNPINGTIIMTLYACSLMPGFFQKTAFYRVLMGIWVILIGYAGVLSHFINLNNIPDLYYSIELGVIAVIINIFGLILNLATALGKFKITTVSWSNSFLK